MRKTVLFSGLICLALTAAPPPQSVGPAHLAFEPNQGQWPSTSSFSTRAPNFTALFSPSGVGFLLGSADHHSKLSMRWLGASPVSTLAPMERLQGTANYYRGSDPAHWITNLPTYKRLKAANIYPGIDVIYYGLDGQFEFDLVLSPGTPVSRIQLAFEGARPRLNTDGDLCFETTSGSLIHHGPVAYQEIAGVRRSVAAHYVIGSSDTVSIAVSSYDKRHALVIDPTVAFATTIGGTTSENEGHAMALDAAGNIYLVGSTFSPSFPTVNALQSTLGASCCGETDAFVSKLSPDGATVLFSTYLGGSGFDTASGVAVDSTGNAVVVGTTSSPDFPVKAAYQAAIHGTQDAFIVKFSPTGSLLYGTYLGGQGTETAWALALDAADISTSQVRPVRPTSRVRVPTQPAIAGAAVMAT